MRLTRAATDRINEVQDWDNDTIYNEYQSLLQHTEEDALDQGELLTLAAICLLAARGITWR